MKYSVSGARGTTGPSRPFASFGRNSTPSASECLTCTGFRTFSSLQPAGHGDPLGHAAIVSKICWGRSEIQGTVAVLRTGDGTCMSAKTGTRHKAQGKKPLTPGNRLSDLFRGVGGEWLAGSGRGDGMCHRPMKGR